MPIVQLPPPQGDPGWPPSVIMAAPFTLHGIDVCPVADRGQLQKITNDLSRQRGMPPIELVDGPLPRHIPLLSGRRKLGLVAAHNRDSQLYSGLVQSGEAIRDLTNLDGAFHVESRSVIIGARSLVPDVTPSFTPPDEIMTPEERYAVLVEEEKRLNEEVIRGLTHGVHHAASERRSNQAAAVLRAIQAGALLGITGGIHNGLQEIGLDGISYPQTLTATGFVATGLLVVDKILKKHVPKPLTPLNSVLKSTVTGGANKHLSSGRRAPAEAHYMRYLKDRRLSKPPISYAPLDVSTSLLPEDHDFPQAPHWHPKPLSPEKATALDERAYRHTPLVRATGRVGLVLAGAVASALGMSTAWLTAHATDSSSSASSGRSEQHTDSFQPILVPRFANAPLPKDLPRYCRPELLANLTTFLQPVSHNSFAEPVGSKDEPLTVAIHPHPLVTAQHPDCFVDYEAGSEQADGYLHDVTVTGSETSVPLPKGASGAKYKIIGLLANGSTPGAVATVSKDGKNVTVRLQDPSHTATLLLFADKPQPVHP